MTVREQDQPLSGEAKARRRRRRVWMAMLVPAVVAVGILQAVKYGLGGPIIRLDGPIDPTFAVIFAVVIVLAVAAGAVWHHRVIDEQEERAILWANTVGFYCFITAAMVAETLFWAGLVPAVSHIALLFACFVPTLATYAWLRFR